MPNFRVDYVDAVIWQWVKDLLEHPENATQGLRNMQEETIRANQSLYDRLAIIEESLAAEEEQRAKLLDLYLSDDFPKEMLQERKARLDETIVNLEREKVDISTHIQTAVVSDEEIAEIEAFCAQLRINLDNPTFEQQRHLIELLDVRGKLAIENDERVVYVKCHLGQQRLSVARTSHWLSNHKGHPVTITARIAIKQKTASFGDHAIIQIGADK